MRYDPERHHRQSVRLREHDYAGGGTYFVTLVTIDRACLFGEIRDGEIYLNAFGLIVDREWARTGVIRPGVAIDVFVVMPNHLHGLITINPPAGDAVGVHGGAPIAWTTTGSLNQRPFATSDRVHRRHLHQLITDKRRISGLCET